MPSSESHQFNANPSLQDFSLVKTYVTKTQNDLKLRSPIFAFYYFVLDLLLNLQADEIDDALTDTEYLQVMGSHSGHDRGIDALHIDNNETPSVIHIFNFKYTTLFKNTKKNFPASEIDKIAGFLSALMQQESSLKEDLNPVLYEKVEEIWDMFRSKNPRFVIHICSNYYLPFEEAEKKRFEREVARYSNFEVRYHLMPDLVVSVTRGDRHIVDGRLRAIDKNLFEKSDGDIRALIVDIDARDLLRVVIDDPNIRNLVDLADYNCLKNQTIMEDAFQDNVRVYLRQRSKINRNIKETALSDENHRFFYFNNGITITCDQFSYPKNQRAPIIDLKNIQVVNGGQTVHALYEAFAENPSQFDDIDVLCRIYETSNRELSTSIAEFTNSQNPVNTRDIRSNDFVQKKLEKELLAKGYFYERKKGQYQGKPRAKRIDAEKAGQALMAFFNQLPAEAKDEKRLIFAEQYDDVFNDQITANEVLLAVQLFGRIEGRKDEQKKVILADPGTFERESFILHASYYILYLLGQLAIAKDIPRNADEAEKIFGLYPDAVLLIRQAVEQEQKGLDGSKEKHSHRVFFKGNRPKKHLEALLNNSSEGPIRRKAIKAGPNKRYVPFR